MKLAVPDLISNSYFPAVAAIELGYFKEEGLAVDLELVFPVDKCYAALREGTIDLVAGSAHSALAVFPEWQGVKLLCAQAQGMYWFLVLRADIAASRGDIQAVKGLRIGAAPWVDVGLKQLLREAGIDEVRDAVTIAPVPGAQGAGTNFGLTAARALEDGRIDGFWANGMGTEVAVRRGAGRILLDVRRGDGPKNCFGYTMASIAATDEFVARDPDRAAAVVRAIARTHRALRDKVELAFDAARKHFPANEASLIVELIRRDLPYYQASISPDAVDSMNTFARAVGILKGDPGYHDVVQRGMEQWWS